MQGLSTSMFRRASVGWVNEPELLHERRRCHHLSECARLPYEFVGAGGMLRITAELESREIEFRNLVDVRLWLAPQESVF